MPIILGPSYTPGSTSGTTNYTLNRDQLIAMALRKLRVYDASSTPGADDYTTGSEALNLMIKSWQMDEISIHLNQEVVLHLAKDGQTYDLGPSGDNCCLKSEAGKTALTDGEPNAETSIVVDSATGIEDADAIGIELDDGTLHWDVVNGAPVGTTVTITTGLAGAAAAGNYVFHYTNKISRPLEIVESRIRDTDDNDEPIEIITDNNQFMAITDKTSSGDCMYMYLMPHITNSLLYTWPVCDNVKKRIVMTIRRVIEDLDASTDNVDAPVEVLDTIVWNLAYKLAPEYRENPPAVVAAEAERTYKIMKKFYREDRNVQIAPA